MGFPEHAIEVSDTLLPLKGYAGDFRKGKNAHVRIKGTGWGGKNYVGSASNDLGFEQMEDGSYRFHVSRNEIGKYGEIWQRQLTVKYAVETIKKVARQEGHEFTVPVKQGENLQITVRSYY
jgi:hypothetical protein